jgi:hypothetical protein
MSSEIKADKWSPASGTSATIGDSGDTYTVPSGVTFDIASGATLDATGATVTGITSTTINNNADNRVITGSGTANTLEGESGLTYDGTHLVIANDGAGDILQLQHTGGSNTGNTYIEWNTGGASSGLIGKTSGADERFEIWNKSDDYLALGTNNTERMRVRSNGYVGVIKNSGDTYIQRRFSVYGAHVDEDGLVWIQTSNGSGDTNLMLFFDGNTNNCGEITLNASANTVSYNSSSDYRLKQNATDIADGITRLKQLKPYRFQWKSDPDKTVDGFFAHETQEVVPEAVHGTKDAMKTAENVVVNPDGSVECYNISQADWEQGKIDGKYASNSTWEATKEVETLEAKVAALESA